MEGFVSAVKNGLDAIELDVWLTTDDILVITHGGANGELDSHLSASSEYIFNKSLQELLALEIDENK